MREGSENSSAEKNKIGAIKNQVVGIASHNQRHVDQAPMKSIDGKTPIWVKGIEFP